MAADTDKFIVATFALWAGDFQYVEDLLQEFSPPNDTPSIDERADSPEDFIRATGALRLRQLWQKRGEFKKLAAEHLRQGIEITDKPTILETKHLRAALWRTGEREFLMQGYLKELGWQQGLFDLARREASGYDAPKLDVPLRPADLFEPDEPDLFETARQPLRSSGVAWAIPQNPFMQVELTDLGLLEATGLWIQPQLPANAEPIEAAFQTLLSRLDPPTGHLTASPTSSLS